MAPVIIAKLTITGIGATSGWNGSAIFLASFRKK